MHNFLRIIRIGLKNRWTVIFSVLCALGVGVMWGCNIGPIYPFIEVLVKGESPSNWVSQKVENSQLQITECNKRLVELQQLRQEEKNPEKTRVYAHQIKRTEQRLDGEKGALRRYEWLKPVTERYLPSSAFEMSILLAIVLFMGSLIKSLFFIAQNLLVARITQLTVLQLRRDFYVRTLKMDLGAFQNNGASDLMSRFTNDMGGVMNGLNIVFGKMIREPLKLIFCFLGAALISWRLLLLCLVVLPIAGLGIVWLAKSLKRTNRRAMEGMSKIYQSLDESFNGMEVVQAFTLERYERHKFFLNCKDYFRKTMKIAFYDTLNAPLTELTSLVIVAIAIIVGAQLTLTGDTHLLGIRMSVLPLSSTDLLVFFAFLMGAADPARKMADIFTQVQNACAAADRIYEKIDAPLIIEEPSAPLPLPAFLHSIQLKNVNFGYQPSCTILKDINLTIKRGETVAIVGLNGCGKSTLLKLLPRFIDPDEGETLVDGKNLRDIRLRDWRSQISLVPQNPLLFDDTVWNNIRFGAENATDQQVLKAAQMAYAADFIENDLPEGYQTVVGPRGSKLSGGQRQRIALARAIVRDPKLFLLDEATREIDLKSELDIRKSLLEFTKGRTTVLITHDMALLSIADKVVMMEEGRILDLGTHQELMSRCDAYRILNEIQFSRNQKAAG